MLPSIPSSLKQKLALCSEVCGDASQYSPMECELELCSAISSPERRSQFLSGRLATSRCLKQLGCENLNGVGRGSRGEPLWPNGVVGSITHTAKLAVAAAAWRKDFSAVGIDLESRQRAINIDIRERIADEEENSWIADSKGKMDTNLRLLLLFCAKESIYKAFYPIVKTFIGFNDVHLCWDGAQHSFKASLLSVLSPDFAKGFAFTVGAQVSDEVVFTYTLLPAR